MVLVDFDSRQRQTHGDVGTQSHGPTCLFQAGVVVARLPKESN
jgi:hypothetical protein